MALISALKEEAGVMMATVVVLDVYAIELTHPFGQVAFEDFNHQMIVD
jgi:hypothetical protein